MTRTPAFIALLLTTLLSGCSILPKSEPLNVYRLPAAPFERYTGTGQTAWTLQVDRPQSSQTLDSTRIAVLPQGNEISAYKGARWSDRAPQLLRDRIIAGMLDDGRIRAVSSDDNRLQTDLQLSSDLRAFQSEYRAGKPQAHVVVDARLVRRDSQTILEQKRFEVREDAADTSVPAVVSAFGKASDQLTREVMAWSLKQGQSKALRP